MGKIREIACIHYKAEHDCDLGREGTFRKQCQICSKYRALPGGKPARKNLKRERQEKFMRDKRNW